MRLPLLLLAAASLALSALPASADIGVAVNQVQRLSFSGAAADVVVGNPEIADVVVVDGRNVFVTGRAEGVTDVVVLDAAGRILWNDSVAVGHGGGRGPVVSITRGAAVTSVSCSGRCQDSGASVTRGAPTAAASRAPAQSVTAPTSSGPDSAAAQAAATAPPGAAAVGSAG